MPSPEPLIVKVIRRYFPDWEPPEDKHEWNKCLCPFHGETRKSAVVSFTHNAFKCFACPAKGSAVRIIKQQEGVSLAEANRLAEDLPEGGNQPVSPEPPRVPRRRVFGDPGSHVPEHPRTGRKVPPRVRRRPFAGARDL
ncbi:CHC2 zinc finger domain-containing protein [Mycobacterium avium]|uniref:CHC2 zinc finger domain-containing protein n=1 Tax=Mycobacterium avium TaxID=1764 RepID=UPI001CE1D682